MSDLAARREATVRTHMEREIARRSLCWSGNGTRRLRIHLSGFEQVPRFFARLRGLRLAARRVTHRARTCLGARGLRHITSPRFVANPNEPPRRSLRGESHGVRQ